MLIFKILNKYFFVLTFGALFSSLSFSVQVNTTSKRIKRTRTFLDESFKTVRKFIKSSTNLTSDFSVKCKPPGGTEFVLSDGFFHYKSTNYFSMTVSGECPYNVIVSNNFVYTTFPKTGETDVRPLAEGEKIFEDFLGISPFYNQKDYVINFFIKENLYIVSAILKPEICANLSADFLNNARKAVKRELWIDPDKDEIVRAQVITLEGKDTTFYY